MFNPFDLRGPEFLIFYAVMGIAVNLVLRYLFLGKQNDGSATPRVCTDPYKLAALRVGASEALRIALFSLIDRGLLKSSGDTITAEPHAREMAKGAIEERMVNYFAEPGEAADMLDDPFVAGAADKLCRELAEEGLLADSKTIENRRKMSLVASGFLVGLSAVKIALALSRGRHTIVFLLVLTVIFVVWARSARFKIRTGAGDELLRRAEIRFRPVRERAESLQPGGTNNDAVYLAAIFGLAALPSDCFPYIPTLFPQPVAAPDSGGYSGSSGCSSCGGGGGCGGGCGGCGD
jgi:uncharacterized protein (TIGR04222 family)